MCFPEYLHAASYGCELPKMVNNILIALSLIHQYSGIFWYLPLLCYLFIYLMYLSSFTRTFWRTIRRKIWLMWPISLYQTRKFSVTIFFTVTQEQHGLISDEEKTKLDKVAGKLTELSTSVPFLEGDLEHDCQEGLNVLSAPLVAVCCCCDCGKKCTLSQKLMNFFLDCRKMCSRYLLTFAYRPASSGPALWSHSTMCGHCITVNIV